MYNKCIIFLWRKILNMFNNDKKRSYDKNDSANTFLAGLLVPIVVSFALIILIAIVASMLNMTTDDMTTNPVIIAITTLCAQFAFILIVWVYNKKKNIEFKKAIKFKKVNVWLCVGAVVTSVAFLFLSSNLVTCVDALLRLTGYSKSSAMPFDMSNVGWVIFSIFGLALLPAFFEEVLFRGMVLGGLIDKKSSLKRKILMLVIASVAFACIHQSCQQFFYPFVCGMVFGAVYLFSGNIWYSMLMHFAGNTTVIIINALNAGSEVAETVSIDFGFVMISIALFIVALIVVALYLYLIKKLTKQNEFFEKEVTNEVTIVEPEELEETKLSQEANKLNDILARNKFLIGFGISIIILIADLSSYIK